LSIDRSRCAELKTSWRSYGERFVVLEKAVGSAQYERLTLKHIRSLTVPGDKVLHRRPGNVKAMTTVNVEHVLCKRRDKGVATHAVVNELSHA